MQPRPKNTKLTKHHKVHTFKIETNATNERKNHTYMDFQPTTQCVTTSYIVYAKCFQKGKKFQ